MNREFVSKMLKAKQMELDAIAELLTESAQGHMKVICNELKTIVEESVVGACTKACEKSYTNKTQSDMQKSTTKKAVNKINIE